KSHDTVLGFLALSFGDGERMGGGGVPNSLHGGRPFGLRPQMKERDRQAWRYLADELEAVNWLAGTIPFFEFRRIVSEITALRTVDRWTSAITAPGLPAVRIMSPQSLGYRDYRWIFAPGLADGEFPARPAANPLLPDE